MSCHDSHTQHSEMRPKDVTQAQQQRPEVSEDVPLVEFVYLVFTCMPGESYHRQFRSFVVMLVGCLSSANLVINSLVR